MLHYVPCIPWSRFNLWRGTICSIRFMPRSWSFQSHSIRRPAMKHSWKLPRESMQYADWKIAWSSGVWSSWSESVPDVARVRLCHPSAGCRVQLFAGEPSAIMDLAGALWFCGCAMPCHAMPCPTSPILHLFHTVSCNFHAVSNVASHCYRHLMLRICCLALFQTFDPLRGPAGCHKPRSRARRRLVSRWRAASGRQRQRQPRVAVEFSEVVSFLNVFGSLKLENVGNSSITDSVWKTCPVFNFSTRWPCWPVLACVLV